MTTTNLIGANAAAAILGITRGGVHAMVKRGDLTPAARLGDRRVAVFERAAVEALAKERAEK